MIDTSEPRARQLRDEPQSGRYPTRGYQQRQPSLERGVADQTDLTIGARARVHHALTTLRPDRSARLTTDSHINVTSFSNGHSGVFSFGDPADTELLFKVEDGCSSNGYFGVSFAAATDVGFTVTVTDTQSGETRTWENELGTPVPAVTDTSAFATCP